MKRKRYNPVSNGNGPVTDTPSSGSRLSASKVTALLSRISSGLGRMSLRRKVSAFSYRVRTNGVKGAIRKYLPVTLLAVFVLAAVGVIVWFIRPSATTTDSRISIAGPVASLAINREFQFPLVDDKGKEVTKVKYTIEQAELRNEIIVQGKRAIAVQGRTFLILNLKIVNDYSQAIQMNVRDYIRLSVNGNRSELLAAEIHNDPVTVQAISTKYTRLGFPINDSDKNIVLLVGEISAEQKEDVPLNFQ